MTYDPSHRHQPPRQERWPEATPAEPWQAYREDESYPYGAPLAAADRQGSHRATAGVGSRSQLAHGLADSRNTGYRPLRAPDPLPSHADPFPGPTMGYSSAPAGRHSGNRRDTGQNESGRNQWDQNNWGQNEAGQNQWSQNRPETGDRSQHDRDGNSYGDAGTSAYGTQPGYGAQPGYPTQVGYGPQTGYATQAGYGPQTGYATQAGYSPQTGYATQADYGAEPGYGAQADNSPQKGYGDGFDGAQDGFDGARVSQRHGRPQVGYADAAQGYVGEQDGYGVQDEFSGAPGYAENRDSFGVPEMAEAPYGYYRDPDDFTGAGRAPAGTILTAPDHDVYPEDWQSDQEQRWESKRRGLIVGAMTGFLATAAASAVSILAAAFVRPQASPLLAAYDAFIDRMPVALRDFALSHFGTHERDVLLLGLYVSVALLGLGIGMLARRAAALGVAGLAALCVLGAFVTITRPQGQVIDVLPSVAGGLAGVVALLWLMHASAPIVAPRQSRRDEPRTGR